MGKYEDALERARQGMPIDEVFPELKESEDERIRKDIMFLVDKWWDTDGCVAPDFASRNEMHDWLEKQKEQPKEELVYCLNGLMQDYIKEGKDEEEKKHRFKCYKLFWDALEDGAFFEQKEQKQVGKIEPKFKVGDKVYAIRNRFECTIEEIDETTYYGDTTNFDIRDQDKWKLVSELEQKPAEWSEEYREEDVQTRFAFYTYKDDPSVLYLSNVFVEEASRNHGFGARILKAAEKAAEAIGATTIRLKVKQDSLANVWYRKNGYGYMTFEDGYDWLEKNLEYMKPTKQEWSEEDEKMRKAVLDEIEYQIEIITEDVDDMDSDDQDRYDELISMSVWMEDFPKCMKPHWKPSEEQMEALSWVINYLTDIEPGRASTLALLKFNLKSL